MTIYFYKVSDPYGYLSNFSPTRSRCKVKNWPTVEHYYQAQKFVGTRDANIIAQIHCAPTPEQATALGRDPKRSLRPDWELAKYEIMHQAVLTKFLTHKDIQALLIATGSELIVEDSPTDYYWGCGAQGNGNNYLGKILMSVRQEIPIRLNN